MLTHNLSNCADFAKSITNDSKYALYDTYSLENFTNSFFETVLELGCTVGNIAISSSSEALNRVSTLGNIFVTLNSAHNKV